MAGGPGSTARQDAAEPIGRVQPGARGAQRSWVDAAATVVRRRIPGWFNRRKR